MSQSEDHPADDASYMLGCAKRRLTEVDGLERAGEHEDAFKALRAAEANIRSALNFIQSAKDKLSLEHGLDDSTFGLLAGIEPPTAAVSLAQAA